MDAPNFIFAPKFLSKKSQNGDFQPRILYL